ncbi:MAG TPA: DUF3822 family protein [Ferruginibacter sp.]|nr:DUF3822 family protein [Ferruginibacter sp.]
MSKLNPSFHIPVNQSTDSPLFLIMEMGKQMTSFLWYQLNPNRLAGLAVYQFSKPMTDQDLVQLLETTEILSVPVSQVHVLCDTHRMTLVPDTVDWTNQATDCLDVLCGTDRNDVTLLNVVPARNLQVLYRLPQTWMTLIKASFPSAQIQHSLRWQLAMNLPDQQDLHAFFTPQSIKLVLLQQQQLQVATNVLFQTASDAVYHLLHAMHEHGLQPNETTLHLSGLIEKGSPLFNEIQAYFPQIVFGKMEQDWNLPDAMNQFHQHYFSHLTQLAACVS